MNRILITLVVTALSQLTACSPSSGPPSAAVGNTPEQHAAPPAGALKARLDAAMASAGRPADDKALDATRMPSSVVAFFQVRDGMTVLDVNAAGGYYTELLSAAVGPAGKVYAQNDPAALARGDGTVEKAISSRLADNRLPNVERFDRNLGEMGLSNQVDVAFLVLTLHDLYNFRGEAETIAMLKDIYAALKPGGVLGVVDHVGEASRAVDARELHRIDKDVAVKLLEAASFRIDAESDILANPADEHAKSVFDESIRRRTDRFVIRAKKPN